MAAAEADAGGAEAEAAASRAAAVTMPVRPCDRQSPSTTEAATSIASRSPLPSSASRSLRHQRETLAATAQGAGVVEVERPAEGAAEAAGTAAAAAALPSSLLSLSASLLPPALSSPLR